MIMSGWGNEQHRPVLRQIVFESLIECDFVP